MIIVLDVRRRISETVRCGGVNQIVWYCKSFKTSELNGVNFGFLTKLFFKQAFYFLKEEIYQFIANIYIYRHTYIYRLIAQ